MMNNSKSIIFGGGCFWGVQHYFKQVKGVLNTVVGYTAGNYKSPTYKLVCSGKTGHSEVCKVDYDLSKTNLNILLEHFFFIIDPTILNQQGNDVGTQYRTGIYYNDEEDLKTIQNYIDSIRKNYKSPIVVEVLPATEFYSAEEYHQDYLEINIGGYCHIGSAKIRAATKVDEEARTKF